MELTKKLLKEINGILSLNAPTDGAFKISLGAPCIDSRKVRAGDTFFGISGEGRDGCDYFEDAVVKGAKVVILNNSHRESFEKSDVAAKTGAIAVFVNNTK
ncbi:MAG TPA: Mur ligase domain-containing protein, partial [Candidatus Wallbacteria bacterium]|nr:Mur ligase domain-containing protein [Candidatus Wallbacteria bacterium]